MGKIDICLDDLSEISQTIDSLTPKIEACQQHTTDMLGLVSSAPDAAADFQYACDCLSEIARLLALGSNYLSSTLSTYDDLERRTATLAASATTGTPATAREASGERAAAKDKPTQASSTDGTSQDARKSAAVPPHTATQAQKGKPSNAVLQESSTPSGASKAAKPTQLATDTSSSTAETNKLIQTFLPLATFTDALRNVNYAVSSTARIDSDGVASNQMAMTKPDIWNSGASTLRNAKSTPAVKPAVQEETSSRYIPIPAIGFVSFERLGNNLVSNRSDNKANLNLAVAQKAADEACSRVGNAIASAASAVAVQDYLVASFGEEASEFFAVVVGSYKETATRAIGLFRR